MVLCSATTATCPSRCPLLVARAPIPCLSLSFVSLLQARQRSGTLASTPGLLGLPVRLFRVADKETSGSPKFPGYPSVCMPRSSTPVVSSVLALSHSGLLPSTSLTASAFPLYNSRLSYCPRPYKFRGSIPRGHDVTRPASSLPLASDARYRADPQGSLPACWLDFGWVGLTPSAKPPLAGLGNINEFL
jgi:hypothetical protein